MAESISLFLLLLGAVFMLLAAIGLVRMPDVLMRLHSSTKSATLGVGLIMLGVALFFNDFAIGVRALAIVVFMFFTAPVAAHMIGRAAYLSGVPLWEGTLSDEMRGHYDPKTHALAGEAQSPDSLSSGEPE
ncbi:MAG: monovalent cation/H(+) antiporter subunit G [Anaerolineales bacterium]|nr:monovalent cation/H(+) antiporter subunit G [Anaerolineales bacterium]